MKLKNTLLIASLVFGALCAGAKVPLNNRAVLSDSLQVLFIGNSYTYYNDLPGLVRDLAASVGGKIAPSRCIKGGQRFKGHLETPTTVEMLAAGGFDYVVLQEASYLPSYQTRSVIEEVYPYAHILDSLAKAGSPKAEVIFYMTWGHKNGIVHSNTDYPLDDTYESMQERLKTSYREMAWENGSKCAPVGVAWQRVRAERPELELYTKDMSHPSRLGSYLAANVILATILGKPYESSFYFNIDEPVARYLQKVANETVFGVE